MTLSRTFLTFIEEVEIDPEKPIDRKKMKICSKLSQKGEKKRLRPWPQGSRVLRLFLIGNLKTMYLHVLTIKCVPDRGVV